MIYKIINYKTTSTLFVILLIILFFVIYYMFFYQKENIIAKALNIKTVRIIVCIVYLLIISFIPFDKIFFTFDSPKDILKFYHPNSKIKKIYDYDDYAFILFTENKDEVYGFEYYIKHNNEWILDTTGIKDSVDIIKFKCTVNLIELEENNVTGVYINYINLNNKDIKVEDSLKSSFKKFVFQSSPDDIPVHTYFTIVEGKLDKNYRITINEKKYKVLNK